MKPTPKEIQQALAKLSAGEREAFFSEYVYEKMLAFYDKYNVSEEDRASIGYNTSLFILKLAPDTNIFKQGTASIMIDDYRKSVLAEIQNVIKNHQGEAAPIKMPNITQVLGAPLPKIPTPPNRDEILRQIENPSGAVTQQIVAKPAPVAPAMPARSFIEEKLRSVVFTPKEEKKVVIETPKPPQAPTTPKAPIGSLRPQGAPDPYREPLE